MPTLYGEKYTKADLLRRVGNLAQVAGVREYTYNSGKADGVRAVSVNTGPFTYELLPGRCLDVGFASYKGFPVGYISKSGVCHPAFYNRADPASFHDNFLAGALTTCGLHNIGPASECCGQFHQSHGRVANLPAEKVGVSEDWDGDECAFRVRGTVRHSSFYHEDLVLRRVVTSRLGGACLRIEDEVENLDFAPSPALLLYHAQFGFPFLDAESRLITSPRRSSIVRGTGAEADPEEFSRFAPPTDGKEEICYYHTFEPDKEGRAVACIFNPKLGARGMGAYVRFDTRTLPTMVQWKMLRSREYVCGLEPVNARLDNRSAEEMAGSMIAPMEKRRFALEIGVIEGEEECREFAGAR